MRKLLMITTAMVMIATRDLLLTPGLFGFVQKIRRERRKARPADHGRAAAGLDPRRFGDRAEGHAS